MLALVCAMLGAAFVAAMILWGITARKLRQLNGRYSAIADADAEAARIIAAGQQVKSDAEREAAGHVKSARAKIAEGEAEADKLVQIARSKISDAESEATRIVGAARQRIVDAELESSRILAGAQLQLTKLNESIAEETRRRTTLAVEYAGVKSTFDRLSAEVHQLEENLEDISFGLYKPHYKFDNPEEFKRELDRINNRQKEMIRGEQAATFAVSWTVGGSEREGARMQKQYCKLLLRAFNGECDAAVAKVSWNNATKMEERIAKAFDAINQLGGVMQVSISPRYRDLKFDELRLEHELEEKKRAITEEQRRIREQMREEERAQREAEKAESEAQAEEARFQKALDKARIELAKSKGEEHQRLNAKLVELEQKLTEAHAKLVRAKSMAELTKVGYVYVLSNIGSFGENVYKIGMTRRLDPMDRVKELGDASVPFPFDVHAMVYSEDAPALECALHQHFADRSVNLVNMRKEFFNVALGEVEAFAKERGLTVSFTKLAEAREYRETLEIRNTNSRKTQSKSTGITTFPDSLPVS